MLDLILFQLELIEFLCFQRQANNFYDSESVP